MGTVIFFGLILWGAYALAGGIGVVLVLCTACIVGAVSD